MAKILIKDIMQEKGIKPSMILSFIKISRSTLYNIFNGSKSPTINELEKFAEILNVSIEDLYESDYSRVK